MRAWPALLFAFIAVAGCSDDPSETADTGQAATSDFSAEMPVWNVGQYWSYTNGTGGEFDLVVATEDGGDWVVLNNDATNAEFDYLFDVSFLGPISKSDLSGSQGGQKIQFFSWPLTHEKTWSTTWDGESVNLLAHDVDGLYFHITATRDDGSKFAEYSYDPAIGFWRNIIFYGDDGEIQYAFATTGHGDAYRGDVMRYTDISRVHEVEMIGPDSAVQGVFEVGDVQELYIWWDIACSGQDVPAFAYQPPDDGNLRPTPPLPMLTTDAYGNDDPCPDVSAPEVPIRVDPIPVGPWRFDGVVPGASSVTAWVETRTADIFTF